MWQSTWLNIYLLTNVKTGGENAITAVAAAPFESASVLPITYGYIAMLGADGLKDVTEMALLNANYLTSFQKLGFKIFIQEKMVVLVTR